MLNSMNSTLRRAYIVGVRFRRHERRAIERAAAARRETLSEFCRGVLLQAAAKPVPTVAAVGTESDVES